MARNQTEWPGISQSGKESARMARNQPEWQRQNGQKKDFNEKLCTIMRIIRKERSEKEPPR